jgi:hypothetical protein
MRLKQGQFAHCESRMTYLARDENMQNTEFCRAKEVEYYAKSRATNNVALKSAYEAAAREYAYRAERIDAKRAI